MATQTLRTRHEAYSRVRAKSGSAALADLIEKEPPIGVGEVIVAVFSAGGRVVRRATVEGRPIDRDELMLWLAGAEAAVQRYATEPARSAPQLTTGESALLDEAGFLEEKVAGPGALERTGIEYELLLADSMTLEQAAKMLHLKTTSRLRQCLGKRTLYGVKVGGSWRLPRFQFSRGKLVRGIDQVFPHVRDDAHPLAVKTWFSSPHQDLVLGDDERQVTPLAWLVAGYDAETVARLAEEI